MKKDMNKHYEDTDENDEDRILEELARNPPTEIEKNEIISNFVKLIPIVPIKKPMVKSLVRTPITSFPKCLIRTSKYYDGMFVISCGTRSLIDENFEDLGYTTALQECLKCGGYTTAMIITDKSHIKKYGIKG